MKIALVSSIRNATPPKKYGGVELVVATLANELQMLGHDVTLLASGDSKTTVKLYPLRAQSTRVKTHHVDPEFELSHDFRSTITAADFLSENSFDIIHNHADWFLLPFHKKLKGKIITTCHRNYKQAVVKGAMLTEFKDLPFVSISQNQRRQLPALNYVKTVYNGIKVNEYEFNETPNDYLLFLGRITPLKNPLAAIQIALKTQHRLLIAAKIDTHDEEYYHTKIEPLIDGKQIVFVGEVGHTEKVALLKNARALLSPVAWDEPFGLVNAEAMACGTPVISSNKGALPEIITAKTGFVCSTFGEMCTAVGRVHEIKRADCLKHVQSKFSAEVMAKEYVNLYKALLETNVN